MKKSFIKSIVSKMLLVCMIFSSITVVEAASIPNWKSLYQSKVQQIENEYKQEKRTKDNEYNISYYSLQDIDFDGVPELYHTLVAKRENGYELQVGTEEIYYIKNSRVVLGKIESHNTLGLLPALIKNYSLADRNWQMAMYNQSADKVSFLTKDSWSGSSDRGTVVISELKFDPKKGVLSSTEINRGDYAKGSEPSYVNGYQMISSASTCSIDKNINEDLWKWTPPYVIAQQKEQTEIKDTAKTKTWSEAYRDFIFNKEYNKLTQKYNTKNEKEIKFGLYDFTEDGIPELIARNGGSTSTDIANYVYTYKSGKVSYIGKVGSTLTDLKIVNEKKNRGLYAESGSDGKFKGYFYSLNNNKIVETLILEKKVSQVGGRIDYDITKKTNDTNLYETCQSTSEKLSLYNSDEINSIGWGNISNTAEENSAIFDDVSVNSWFYDAVMFATEKGIMSGVSESKFDPESEITRAMFVTMLYRLEKEPSTSRVNYKDVPKGSWYEDAISWASKKNIANGITDTNFAPDDKITREQLMTFLYRYAKLKNKNITADEYNIKCYFDNNSISSYAVDPMNWAVGNELISGTSKYYLEPSGVATRVQAAVIMQRFCEKFRF